MNRALKQILMMFMTRLASMEMRLLPCARNKAAPGVVKPDKGVGDGADQKVGLRKSHHIVINAAENNAQDGAAEHQNDQHDSDGADRKNGVQLGGAFGGFFTIAPAKVLAADDRAASCQGGQDLDDQNIQAVHQAHAGHSGFAHAGIP